MPISKQGKLYFTSDQLVTAEACSALVYAQSHGYDLVPSGRGRYHLREHDSMVFLEDGRWWWNSRQVNGRALAMLLHYEGLSLPEAVNLLCSSSQPHNFPAAIQISKAEAPFQLPPKAPNCRQLFAYLCQYRRLDRDIVASSIRAGGIYQGQYDYHGHIICNAVFLGRDRTGAAKNAILRGLTSNSDFRLEVPGSDKAWPFLLAGRPGGTCLGLFEAPIDALSEATSALRSGQNYLHMDRMALGGNFPIRAVTNYLDVHPSITTLAVGFDSDDAGRRLTDYLHRELLRTGYAGLTITDLSPPSGKDWNEFLQKGGVTP